MRALVWNGITKVNVETVPDPQILDPGDAIMRITRTAICGSDLHLYDGYVQPMLPGDILGHEFMGEVAEVGPAVKRIRVGDRVLVPFTIACGHCYFCQQDLYSLCDNSNPNAKLEEAMFGYAASGAFGYSQLTGGYAGGQAQFARVPFADVGLFNVPEGLSDEQVLFLTDIFPTGYMAAENADIKPDDTVAVWGCGPVGQFTIRCARMLGAGRVIAIDRFPERLAMAEAGGAETINYEGSDESVLEELKDRTGGRGPDSCIDAVGMESHGVGLGGIYDSVKQTLRMETDRPHVFRGAIMAVRKGGTISVPGVYGGFADKIPLGAFMNKGLTLKTGQTHVHRYVKPLLERVQKGEIDPTFVITHRLSLEDAPRGYEIFKKKEEGCIKVVMDPWAA